MVIPFYGHVQQSLVINRTRDEYPYEYDKVRGNTGKNGIWIFEVATTFISPPSTISQSNVAKVFSTVVQVVPTQTSQLRHSTEGKNCSPYELPMKYVLNFMRFHPLLQAKDHFPPQSFLLQREWPKVIQLVKSRPKLS